MIAGRTERPGVRRLHWFTRDEDGTLTMDGFTPPLTNGEAFDEETAFIDSADDIDELVQRIPPLARVVRSLVADRGDELQDELEDRRVRGSRRHRIGALLDAIEHCGAEYAVQEWVGLDGRTALAACRTAIEEWLGEPADDDVLGQAPMRFTTAAGATWRWFEALPAPTLRELGIRTIEGDAPGSDWDGARLTASVHEANSAARRMGLTCVFR